MEQCWLLLICIVHCSLAGGPFTTDRLAVNAKQNTNISTLVHVHVVWRHGDRTPATVIPTDVENGENSWELGLGELTAKGVAQQYRLGKWLRQRYDAFLGKRFSPAEVYVRSSDFNRTLMSAQANLAGLFPPIGHQKWSDELLWAPIPVHTIPKEDDSQLYESISCPEGEKEQKRIYAEDEQVKRLEEENRRMLDFIGRSAGIGNGNFGLSQMWNVFDPLNSEYHNNATHKLPGWVNATVWKEIIRLYDISCQFAFATRKVKRLRGGMLLKEINERLISKARNASIGGKFFAYSAHDMTIASLLSTLGVHPEQFPPYASMVILEMHKLEDSFILKLFYKNVTDSPSLYEYPIEGCGSPCSLHNFTFRSLQYIPANWKSECGITDWTRTAHDGLAIVFGVTTILLAAILIVPHLRKALEKRRAYSGRMLLPTSENDSCNNAVS